MCKNDWQREALLFWVRYSRHKSPNWNIPSQVQDHHEVLRLIQKIEDTDAIPCASRYIRMGPTDYVKNNIIMWLNNELPSRVFKNPNKYKNTIKIIKTAEAEGFQL